MTGSENDQHERFAEHFVRYQDRIYAHIVALLPNWRDADDAFQQTSLVLWKKWRDFHADADFLSWAKGIAINVVRNQVRQMGRDRLRLSNEVIELVAQRRLELEDLFETRREALTKCLEELPTGQADLLLRCYSRGNRLQEIARTTGQSANALYLKLRRIRHALFKCINRRIAKEGS